MVTRVGNQANKRRRICFGDLADIRVLSRPDYASAKDVSPAFSGEVFSDIKKRTS